MLKEKRKPIKPRFSGCDYRRWCYDRMILLVCEHSDKIIPSFHHPYRETT